MTERVTDAGLIEAVSGLVHERAEASADEGEKKTWAMAVRRLREIAGRLREPTPEQARKAARRLERAKAGKRISPSEALYGFAAWLTTRMNAVTVGDQRDAGEIARLVDEYCRAQGWQPPRDGWELKLKPAPSEECAA
jgi:hypothetical protein